MNGSLELSTRLTTNDATNLTSRIETLFVSGENFTSDFIVVDSVEFVVDAGACAPLIGPFITYDF